MSSKTYHITTQTDGQQTADKLRNTLFDVGKHCG